MTDTILAREHKVYSLPPHTTVSQHAVERLHELLNISDARRIRHNLRKVFFYYLMSEHGALPGSFDEITSDFYFLIDFFEEVEESSKQK